MFAVKDGGKCLISDDDDDENSYQENGPSSLCENGEGFEDAMSVYTTNTGQWSSAYLTSEETHSNRHHRIVALRTLVDK